MKIQMRVHWRHNLLDRSHDHIVVEHDRAVFTKYN